MAAPANIDILDVTGHWSLNQNLSDSLEDTFALASSEAVLSNNSVPPDADTDLAYSKEYLGSCGKLLTLQARSYPSNKISPKPSTHPFVSPSSKQSGQAALTARMNTF